MRLGLKALAGLCILWLTMLPDANASVIYRWQNTIVDPQVGRLWGLIEVDSEVWSQGSLVHSSFTSNCSPAAGGNFCTPFGIIRFEFGSFATVGFSDPIDQHLRDCAVEFCESVVPVDYLYGLGSWTFDLTFGALLSGSIYANDTATDVYMNGGPIWSIASLGSDSGGNCYYRCDDGVAHGLWVRVPEPSTLVLFGLGLLGLGLSRRPKLN